MRKPVYFFFVLFLISLLARPRLVCAHEKFHQTPEYKHQPGWQEPGLWRPKWIMDREFIDKEGNVVGFDRVYLRLRADRTVKVFSSKSRPLIEVFQRPGAEQRKKEKTKIFETGQEEAKSSQELVQEFAKEREEMLKIDGTWWWQDESPLPSARVVFDIRQGPDDERVRHEAKLQWGQAVDAYAAKFKPGLVYKFTGFSKEKDVPIGQYKVGEFIMRPTVFRPLVGKDYQAFQ